MSVRRDLGREYVLGFVTGVVSRMLARYSVPFLRVSLGLVFLGFGLLKFGPGVSPAEGIAERTVESLTLGIVADRPAVVLVALMESAIGVSLVMSWRLRLGLGLLGMAMIGVMSPLVLFPGDLFDGRYNAPTLEGQYVLKDVVLLAAGLVVLAWEIGKSLPAGEPALAEQRVPRPTRQRERVWS